MSFTKLAGLLKETVHNSYEPTKWEVKVRETGIYVSPLHSDSLHSVSGLSIFAEAMGLSCYCGVDDGKVFMRMF